MDSDRLSAAIGRYAQSIVAVELARFNVVHANDRAKRGMGDEMKAAQEALIEELEKLRAHCVTAWVPKQDSEALAQAVAAHVDGWRSATFGWQGDADPIKDADNRQRAIQAHAAECLRRIRATLGVMASDGSKPE